ncbi:hypothetical protein ACT8ZV_02360 [Nocardioides sp. MAHUQ-72]|uniref:hypothetical protein n=1 Tax=unclassified Nocardioides TaxID=2615069 RepID=UPI00361F7AD8
MTSILTTAGTALAVTASAVGVIVGVEQLTLRARLRKTIESAKTLAEPEEGERAVVLKSIHDVAVARLIAGWLVPGWRFAEAIVWLIGAPIALGVTVWHDGLKKDTLLFAGVVLVSLALSNRRGLRLLFERQRIAHEYLGSRKVGPPRIELMHQLEGGTRKEFLFGAMGSLGATLLALGAGALAHDPEHGWPVVLLILGVFSLGGPWESLRAGAVRPIEDPVTA